MIMGAFLRAHSVSQSFGHRWLVLLTALATSALLFTSTLSGAAAQVAPWPYKATVTSGPRSGQDVDLAVLDNITMEDIGAQMVGSATLHVGIASSPYRCLNGTSLNVFSYGGQLFLHNGLQGAQCSYGTWEVVPSSITSPSQLPIATEAHVSTLPLPARPAQAASVVVSGRGFGRLTGTVLLIGQSAVASGPVIKTTVRTWAPGTVVAVPRAALSPDVPYDVLLFTNVGAAATTALRMPRIIPLA